jgi:hypothetical protein
MLFRYCCPLKSLNVLRIIANIQYNTIGLNPGYFLKYFLLYKKFLPIGGVVGFGGFAAKICAVSSTFHRFELRQIFASALET